MRSKKDLFSCYQILLRGRLVHLTLGAAFPFHHKKRGKGIVSIELCSKEMLPKQLTNLRE